MTDDELAEIERTWAAATPGPWRVNADEGWVSHDHGDGSGTIVVQGRHDMHFTDDRPMRTIYCRFESSPQNGAAIAKAPEHVAALLAEVKRLRADLAETEEALQEAQNERDLLQERLDVDHPPPQPRKYA